MPIAFDLYDELTQKMDKVLEPRYRSMLFENGTLIPTFTDLEPGVKELAYPRISEVGDAEIMSDATTDIPMVYLSGEIDRYPVYMVMSSFPVTFQESRMLTRSQIDSMERRMARTRWAISQRINKATALGAPSINFPGSLINPLVTTDNSSVNIYTAAYDVVLDFFVATIRSLVGNYVTELPTDMIVNANIMTRLVSLSNAQQTVNVKERLEQIFPDLSISETPEVDAAQIDAAYAAGGSSRAGTGKDRIWLYPKESMVLNRHIEELIANLAPEEYIRSAMVKGQLARIFPMFSCVSPAIFDYPQDCRYIDILVKP